MANLLGSFTGSRRVFTVLGALWDIGIPKAVESTSVFRLNFKDVDERHRTYRNSPSLMLSCVPPLFGEHTRDELMVVWVVPLHCSEGTLFIYLHESRPQNYLRGIWPCTIKSPSNPVRCPPNTLSIFILCFGASQRCRFSKMRQTDVSSFSTSFMEAPFFLHFVTNLVQDGINQIRGLSVVQ